MQQLLLDLGNTRIKWVLRGMTGLAGLQAIEHADPIWQTQFVAALAALPAPDVIVLAAVAPEMIVAAASRLLAERWPDAPLKRAQSRKQLARFQSAYNQPERMGVDRFLAAVAAAQTAEAKLVIGCGTALTIDLIDARGQHLGGLIAPAPETMRSAVLSRTARVNWLREGSAVDFGSNTEDALEGGVWMAAAGMVERALRKATGQLGGAPALIAHGGSAPMLAKMLDMPLPIEPMLVFQGLAIWVDVENHIA